MKQLDERTVLVFDVKDVLVAGDAPGQTPGEILPGVEEFLEEFAGTHKIILSSGPRDSLTVLGPLLPHFDISRSKFYSEYDSKRLVLGKIVRELKPISLVHIGDAPGDMKAIHEMATPVIQKLAVGVTITGAVTPDELLEAGADMVIQACYTPASAESLKRLLI